MTLNNCLLKVTSFVNSLFETRPDLASFKVQLRDFLIQSKEFSAQVIFGSSVPFSCTPPVVGPCKKANSVLLSSQDNKDLYAEEAAQQREAERRRMLSIPGLIAPSEIQDDMVDMS